MVKNYAVARVTVPLVGQVTDKVARSPTVEAKGWYCDTRQTAVYEGLVLDTVELVGVMTTVAAVLSNGQSVLSTLAAPKSCMKFKVIEPERRPPVTVLKLPPKVVVSTSSAWMVRSTD